MNTLLKKTFASLAILSGACVVSGCVEAESSLSISGPHVGTGSSTDEGAFESCVWEFENGAEIPSPMVLDLSALETVGHFPFTQLQAPFSYPVGSFVAVLNVGNRLTGDTGGSSLAMNQNTVYLNNATIEWTVGNNSYSPGASDGGACEGDGLRQISGVVDTSGSSVFVPVELLRTQVRPNPTSPSTEAECLRGLLTSADATGAPTPATVRVQYLGETTAGVNVETPILEIPVILCDGCATDYNLSASGFPSGATSLCSIE